MTSGNPESDAASPDSEVGVAEGAFETDFLPVDVDLSAVFSTGTHSP